MNWTDGYLLGMLVSGACIGWLHARHNNEGPSFLFVLFLATAFWPLFWLAFLCWDRRKLREGRP